MAPISEKRLQQQPPHLKDSSSHSHSHAKENATANRHSGKKGLEILDFHESWLEEMELYKDKLFVQKNKNQHLLGSHNHIHTPQGCQFESHPMNNNNHNTNNNNNNKKNSHINNKTVKNCANNNHKNNNNESSPATTKQRGAAEQTKHRAAAAEQAKQLRNAEQTLSIKPRITIRNTPNSPADSAAAAAAAAAATTSASSPASEAKPNSNVQLILKRPRDDASLNSKTTASHPKRQNHAGKNPAAATTTIASTTTPHKQNNIVVSPHSPNGTSSINITTKPAKIIVNQFHASSLLSSQHQEEKTKILTLNGLTKSAATAYETSLYASNYLPQDNRTGLSFLNTAKQLNDEHANYIGVSLAKCGEGDRQKGGAGDDPCAAIDDVNEYTDSDTDEEYTGQPFFLKEDSLVPCQSRNIRHPEERIPSEDSESDHPEYYQPKCILSPSIFPNVPPYLNFSSHAVKGPPMPQALHKVLKWKLSPVMPKIVKRVVLNSGFRIIKNTTDWMAIWEKHMKSPGFRTIRSHQKYNHMPGSFRIGRKDSMWKSLHNNMKKFGNKEFGFMQKSYIMPEDLESLRQVWPKNASKLTKWIVKPPASARGTGIRIVNKWSQFPKDRPLVVQKYIERPLLINENKFDLRIYVVVTSVNPLRIYMYKDGLARFASVKYSSELNSLDDRCMHLTNYSINKFSQNYSKNEDFNACQGHKWTLQSLWSCLEGRNVNTKHLWATLRNLVIKAIISGESGLNRTYRQNVNFRYNCFELFGFDVLLDENIIPWLLEINISPSLHSELPLDLHVKGPLIQAVLNTALYQVPPKLNERQQNEILEELGLEGPLCHDKRIFTTCLTAEEVRKHNQFTNRSIEYREEYIDSILENLLPDDVRCLIISEDELARCAPLERVFPTADTHIYLKFIDNPRYYNRLLDAWEHKYGHNRAKGIKLIKELCQEGYHLEVSDAALEKEPNVAVTEIDMLHVKKSDDQVNQNLQVGDNSSVIGSGHASKAGSPDSIADTSATIVTVIDSSSFKEPTDVTKKLPKDEGTFL